jgi:hypothetical protein
MDGLLFRRPRKGLSLPGCLLVLGAALLWLDLPRARAADPEARDFAILVDGKNAGNYHITIQNQPDGSVAMSAQSNVRVTILAVPVYTYSYTGMEVWKANRLQHFVSSGKENSKTFAIRAEAAADGLHVNADGQEHITRPDIWTTSCWHLPDAAYRNQLITLMGCDNGLDISGRLQFVGTETIQVAGQPMTCSHYQVLRETAHDVWYDVQERLVRHEWTSDGHHTVLEMTGLRH